MPQTTARLLILVVGHGFRVLILKMTHNNAKTPQSGISDLFTFHVCILFVGKLHCGRHGERTELIQSVSLDLEGQKWREFIGEKRKSWPQYRDGGFTGPIAKMHNVTAIPYTFTIDVDGVLQEEHVFDASLEGDLKKLLALANCNPRGLLLPNKTSRASARIEFRSTAPVREVESVLAMLPNPIAIEQRRRLASWHRGAP